ncbi:MAG: PAS domain-containing protein [Rhodospirillales bacterium]|nr:PAS domain-containing protein [Rhodospirillales bacterium]
MLPARGDIDPLDIPALLPNAFLVDVSADGARLIYRLVGTAIIALFGEELTGRMVGDRTMSLYREEVLARYAGIVASRRPFHHWAQLRHQANDFTDVERLIPPLSDDGVRVNMLLGMVIPRDGKK